MFCIELFQNNLNTKIIGNQIFYHSTTDSTNSDIWRLFKKEKKEGFVVIANEQHSGRGRDSKKWYSKKNTSIICSFLIKQKFPIKKIGLHSILVPVGILKGIKEIIDEDLSIKWPNDIVFENKKLGGILIETKTFNDSIYLNIGIGINVNENLSDFPDEIKDSATSLKIISNRDIQREILLANILNAIDKLLNSQSEEDILEYWMQSCNHINREIKIKYKNKIVTADFKKINQKGQAIINYNSKDLIFDGAILNI